MEFSSSSSTTSTTKTRSNKNRGFKTKLFLCFKPVATVDEALEPSTYSSILSSALTTVAECNEGSGGWRWWRKNRDDDDNNCLWHILKKALNHTSLLKKIKNRKKAKKYQFSRSSGTKQERKFGKISKEESKSIRSSSDSIASSSLCTSSVLTQSSLSASTSSSSSSLRTLPSSSSSFSSPNGHIIGLTIKKHLEDTKDSGKGLIISSNHNSTNNNNTTLFITMISSLVVLILWGKFFAILCTSLWFYLMPRRKCDLPAGDDRAMVDEFDSVEYKKKIIMKGLLQRNHSRLSINAKSN